MFLTLFAARVFSQTADEVVDKFLKASGGREKLAAIKTLQYKQEITMTTPLGEITVPIQFFKERNKLFRMQSSINFGAQGLSFFTVVTDTAGYIMLPAIPMMGSQGGLTRMTEEERTAQTYQADPSGLFADLVDYKLKGNKVELAGVEKVSGEDCYKLKLTLKNGPDLMYYISKASGLVVRADAKGEMAVNMSGLGGMLGGGMESQVQKAEISTLYSDYVDVKGVKFPTKLVIKNQMGDASSVLSGIMINEPIEAKWYRAE